MVYRNPYASEEELVADFHEAFGHPIRETTEATADFDRIHLRFDLIAEEFFELMHAIYGNQGLDPKDQVKALRASIVDHVNRNLVEVADATADMKYVLNGLELEAGISGASVFREVHRSNMTKLGIDGKPIYNEAGKVMKGEHYSPADVAGVLRAFGAPTCECGDVAGPMYPDHEGGLICADCVSELRNETEA